MTAISACRGCGSAELKQFLDLGETPLADALVTDAIVSEPSLEERFPLAVAFCPVCALVQITEDVEPTKLFVDNYLYFSSFSDHLLRHSREHALNLIATRGLDADSLVVELASNDGYLLKNFVDEGVPVVGFDPAPDQAEAANRIGVPTRAEFFGLEAAKALRAEGKAADVIIANNVMAHIPDPNDFVAGMAHLLADDGLITVENPSVWDLVDRVAFDTIYHEHFFYHSCTSVKNLVERHGLHLNHVEYFPDLHGGTNRWHIGHRDDPSPHVLERLAAEHEAGLDDFEFFANFGGKVDTLRRDLLDLLGALKAEGKTIAAYGAAAKGATMVNATGIGTELVDYVVDRNVHKQGRFMPGTHQPIVDPAILVDDPPDALLLLAWNFASEIMAQQSEYADNGGRFIVPVPSPELI
ncbi:MAG: class I SAM-dependent methyltransferase [Ilumatobacter sp.]|uniref:class I SAM-dependent methyltransferase n=1 Tax=Ilumatobacter sp. TaxID=1967498 RepID=UPI00260B9FBB|nr:class I SAM-dependent methyltransferase [Ilumatobacter sp.]MDJ0768702.1 class I SAM-dependent methyltransferase [Ilumatobacter sp.]